MHSLAREQLTGLAIELETLADADALDGFTEEDILTACERFGPTPLMAGLLLFFCSRAKRTQVERLWTRLSPSARRDFCAAMIAIHPLAAINGIGLHLLCDFLRSNRDRALHEQVARTLCANAIPDSEECLAPLTESARDVLAFKLAERAGRERDGLPAWVGQMPETTRRCVRVGFAIGASHARMPDRFASTVASFDPVDWRALGEAASANLSDLGVGFLKLLSPYRDRLPVDISLPWPIAPESAAVQVRSAEDRCSVADTTDSEQAVSIVTRAAAASAEELRDLLIASHRLRLPNWQREARRAILRRATQLRTKIADVTRGLPREIVLEEIVAGRLERGDVGIVRCRAWRRLDLHRRFTLVAQTISAFRARAIVPTADGLAHFAQAIVEMPAPLDGILATRVLEELGDREELTPSMFETLAAIGGATRNEVLTALGRACALRGDDRLAHEFIRLARDETERTLAADAQRRLTDILDHPNEFPADPLAAVTLLLATVPDAELSALIRVCISRLSATASEIVLAGVFARGRASAAVAGIGA